MAAEARDTCRIPNYSQKEQSHGFKRERETHTDGFKTMRLKHGNESQAWHSGSIRGRQQTEVPKNHMKKNSRSTSQGETCEIESAWRGKGKHRDWLFGGRRGDPHTRAGADAPRAPAVMNFWLFLVAPSLPSVPRAC